MNPIREDQHEQHRQDAKSDVLPKRRVVDRSTVEMMKDRQGQNAERRQQGSGRYPHQDAKSSAVMSSSKPAGRINVLYGRPSGPTGAVAHLPTKDNRRRLTRFGPFSSSGGQNSCGEKFQGASSDSSLPRVSVAIQFTSQVLPPSSENDCSKRTDVGVISEMTNRTRIARPLNVSCP